MAPKYWLGHVLLLVSSWGQQCRADFTTTFEDVTQGSVLALAWGDVDPDSLPLIIGVSLINKTEDGSAYGVKINISTTVTDSSFLWPNVPYPVAYIPTAMYQVEVRPSHWKGDQQPVLARSPFFTIGPSHPEGQPGTSPSPDDPQPTQPGSSPHPNRRLAVALAVGIGLPSLVAGVLVGWCVRRRRRRAAEALRRRRRMEFVIN
ncbi:hypothetical protein QBC33DRAFT_597861 [Phialemonium atrogriseum]|uniref:Uncharacterized protein n=1 Tax=Phialemonium atrogriseum TaxID=1093897 RepID=A0AAJ0FQF3_9PEZI|nr:uncharacterized protein QBC33DRAFT_597861 [Phialemonium atrogriseum]KAK1771179.1 hypothetical protein QBC33DRAFT_597861 [Phialemonium atrogriseum]